MGKIQELLNRQEAAYKRSKSRFVFDSLILNISEHLIKLHFYSEDMPDNVSGWNKELSAWAQKVYRLARGKKGSNNIDKAYAKDALVDQALEDKSDIDIVLKQLAKNGYPKRKSNDQDVSELHSLAKKYITYMLSGKDWPPKN